MNYLTNYYKNRCEQLQEKYNTLLNKIKYLKEADEKAGDKPVEGDKPEASPKETNYRAGEEKDPRLSGRQIARSEKQDTWRPTANPSNEQYQWMRNFMNELYAQFHEQMVRWIMSQVFSGRIPTTQEIAQYITQAWPDMLLQQPPWMRQTLEMMAERLNTTIGELGFYDPSYTIGFGAIGNKSEPFYLFSGFALHPDGSVPYPWNPAGRPLDNNERDNWITMPWGLAYGGDESGVSNFNEELARLVFNGLPRDWYHPNNYPE